MVFIRPLCCVIEGIEAARWPNGYLIGLLIKRFGFELWMGTLRYVLGEETLLLQCLTLPRCKNRYRRANLILGVLTLRLTSIPSAGGGAGGK